MKRVRRWMFNAAAVASTLLLAAVLVLWVRSYRIGDEIAFIHENYNLFFVGSYDGTFDLERQSQLQGRTQGYHGLMHEELWIITTYGGARICDWWFDWPSSNGYIMYFALPDWLPAVLFPILPGIGLRRILRRLNPGEAGQSLCPACGYDVRASKDTCPECGAAVASGNSAPGRQLMAEPNPATHRAENPQAARADPRARRPAEVSSGPTSCALDP